MTSRVLLLLGLLGLILLMLAGCDWISRWFAEWMYRTSIISWILSFGPNYMSHFVVATVQSVLLNWAFPSLLYAVLHIKVQRMTLTGPIYSTSKLELTFQSFEYSSQDICIQISVLCIAMDIFPTSSESPCIYICKPKVTINFAKKGTHNQTKNGLPTNDPETTAPTYLETFPNYLQRELLQFFLRCVDFSFTNGVVQVIDKSRQFQLNVNLNFEKIWYDKFIESKLLIIGLWASIDLVDAFRKANFGCESCKITFSNFRKRSQPYSNKLMNILFDRQHLDFNLEFMEASFHLGRYRSKEFKYEPGDSFYVNMINIKVVNFLTGTQEKGKLDITAAKPVYLSYNPGAAKFVVSFSRYMAQYRSTNTSHHANVAPMPTTQQTFPAALDMMIEVTLCRVSFMLWNENKSCLWIYCEELSMIKSLGETKIKISDMGLQMGDYRKAENFTWIGEDFFIIDSEENNEKLAINEIIIRHVNPHADHQRLFINLKNVTITCDMDGIAIWKHIRQMVKEMRQLTTELTPQMPPFPLARRSAPICEILVNTIRGSVLLFKIPTIKIKVNYMKAVIERNKLVNVYDAVITVAVAADIEHKFLCFESQDNDGWTIDINNEGKLQLNIATLGRLVFHGLVPVKKLKEFIEIIFS